MPWRHFQNHKADEVALGYRISLENHFSTQQNINPSKIILEDDETKTVLFQDNILSFNEPPIPLGNMNVGKATVEKTFDAGTQLPAIINALNTLDNEEKAVVNTFYIVNPSNQDTAKAQAIFDNYFAYDDGSAELALVGARLGDQVAVKFRANVPDTLRAVQLFIPHILGSVTSQRFNLKVWLNDLNSTPAFKLDFVKPVYVDSLGGWTTYSLDTTPLALPVGDFYIGWQQALDPPSPNQAIPVGYDRNNPDKVVNNFMNIGNGWQLLTSGTAPINDGAVMIRAIVGDFTPFTSETKEIKAPVFAKVYPNPADDVLFVEMTSDLNAYQYRIFNVAGQLVKAGNASENIDIAALVTGFYVLELQHKTNYSKLHHKFVKR
jgi:hypothetical protein